MLDCLFVGMVLFSLVWGCLNGCLPEVSAAALQGMGAAAELMTELCGALCLWSGILRLLDAVGASRLLGRLLKPLLRLLYPRGSADPETLSALTVNLSANLLGLGNAATPSGLQAADRLQRLEGGVGRELRRLLLMNSVSVQLLPTTVCALRAACGSTDPYDLLPAVWLCSLAALLAGLLFLRLTEGAS